SALGMVFVECAMDKYDAPLDLILGGHAIADTDYGARGPQTVASFSRSSEISQDHLPRTRYNHYRRKSWRRLRAAPRNLGKRRGSGRDVLPRRARRYARKVDQVPSEFQRV